MPSAKFTQTYEAVSKMGEKLKAAGKQGPSNDEQLHVRRGSFTQRGKRMTLT
jgi:diazepam-binding inhibitor (GABA receptor modulating acyl-CoA-binding protein)